MDAWLVLAVSGLYIAALFAVAWAGERRGGRPAGPFAYALTLAVYNTVWSFYGSVGRAAASGWDFLPIYLGPTLLLLLAMPVAQRVVRVAKAANSTSIADFLAARYGRSQALAALVTVAALVSVLPYIALQLKGISASFDTLTAAAPPGTRGGQTDTALAVTALMAAFAILFGVRHVHASEHHRGLMRAIAFESLVKLAAFILVGLYVVYGLNDGFLGIYAEAAADPALAPLLVPDLTAPTWLTNTAISVFAFLCLPQLFHVAVVENEDPGHLRKAAWLYPGYLAILSLFMLPVALTGLATFGRGGVDPDGYVVSLPLHAGDGWMALLAFIGGFSAGTGMVIMAAVSLSTMLCNDVVLPALIRAGALDPAGDRTRALLAIRRAAVGLILGLAYGTYRLLGDGHALTTIGLMSFVAVAQFGPSFLAGLYWPRAGRAGALAGLAAGLLLWAYCLALPAIDPGAAWVAAGPFGLGWLSPHALFGLTGLDPISHAVVWSLLANGACLLAFSLLARQAAAERERVAAFIGARPGAVTAPGAWRGLTRVAELRALAGQYLGHGAAERAIDGYLAARPGGPGPLAASGLADADLVRFTETLLAGAVGAASARVVVAGALRGLGLSRGDAVGLLGEATDAIRSNHGLLRSTLESVSQGICVLDPELRLLTWNRRFLELLDFPEGQVRVGVPLADLVRFNAARGEYAVGDLDTLLVSRDLGRTHWPYVFTRQRPDGTVVEVSNTPMPGGGFVATYTDVTERHAAAAALKAANEGLEQRVRERTAALERADAARTRFLAGISHDLLQPLSAARLFSAALVERLAQGDPGGGALGIARDSAAAVRSVEELIGALLDLSTLEAGAVRAEVADVPLGPLLSRLAAEHGALAREAGLGFRAVPCGLAVRTDPALLRRILQNFLSNAVRHTPSGRVLLGCRRVGGALRVEVWDTGPGIEPHLQAEIFTEFRRLDPAQGRPTGLGLGLAVVDRAARLLGHPVSLRSLPGKGSCFAVTLPIAGGVSPCGAAPVAPTATPILRGLRVLCVDNEPAVLAGLAALLEGWGCVALRAADLAGARAALGGVPPDAVVVDYHLDDGWDGLSLLARLSDEWGAAVPAVLVTADRSGKVAEAAQAAGVVLLPKPARPAALRRFLTGVAMRRGAPVGEEVGLV